MSIAEFDTTSDFEQRGSSSRADDGYRGGDCEETHDVMFEERVYILN